MKDFPKLSIICVSFNAEATLERAIRSLVDQEYPNLEFIVIDGGSSDSTTQIIKKYENSISYWHSKPDQGASHALNIGISKATGDLVAFLFADDYFEFGILEKVASAYKENEQTDMISFYSKIVKYDQKNKNFLTIKKYQSRKSIDLSMDNMLFRQPLIANRFIKRRLFSSIGNFIQLSKQNHDFFSNDREFLIRAALNKTRNITIPQFGYNYVASLSSRTLSQNNDVKMKILKEHTDIAKTYSEIKELTHNNKAKFLAWKNISTLQLFFLKIKNRDYSEAIGELKNLSLRNMPYTIFYLIKKIIWRKF